LSYLFYESEPGSAASFRFTSIWSPHKDVLERNAPFGSGKQGIALQAGNVASLNVKRFNGDDLIFRLASWAGEGDRKFKEAHR
jgi:hypothetical protein